MLYAYNLRTQEAGTERSYVLGQSGLQTSKFRKHHGQWREKREGGGKGRKGSSGSIIV